MKSRLSELDLAKKKAEVFKFNFSNKCGGSSPTSLGFLLRKIYALFCIYIFWEIRKAEVLHVIF